MTHVIYILIIAFLLGAYVGRVKTHKRDMEEAEIAFQDLNADYHALDQGMSEISDAYATDMAQYEDTIAKKLDEIGGLEARVAVLESSNSTIQGTNLDLHTVVEHLTNELHDCREAGLASQKIVAKHNYECLPALEAMREVATEMEKFIEETSEENLDAYIKDLAKHNDEQ